MLSFFDVEYHKKTVYNNSNTKKGKCVKYMKYAVFINSGMADRPMPEHQNITPLSSAEKPCIDRLAAHAEIGLTKTTEITQLPVLEKAALSLFGYDPAVYFKGSSPLYAANENIALEKEDVIFQCNFVTLSDEELYEEKTLLSDDTDDLSQEERDYLFRVLSEEFNNDIFEFVRGKNQGIFLIWKKGEPYAGEFTSPYTALSQCIADYLPKGDFIQPLDDIMRKSHAILKENRVNALWIWNEGCYSQLETFKEKFGLNTTLISHTDFINGIGKLSEMKVCDNISDIAETALKELANSQDMVYIYTDSALGCGLDGDFDGKVKVIEEWDKAIFSPLVEGLQKSGEDFGIMVISDIAVPVYLQRYSGEPVPYLIYHSNSPKNSGITQFDENTAADSSFYFQKSFELINRLIQ